MKFILDSSLYEGFFLKKSQVATLLQKGKFRSLTYKNK